MATEPLPAPVVRVVRLPGSEDLPLPAYMTPGAAGADLVAANSDPIDLAPGARALVPTGLTIEVPPGFEAQVRPRSGLALKHGLTLLNTPGTIDSDYRGPVGVIVINHGQAAHTIHRGDRIAQLVIAPVAQAVFEAADVLEASARGAGGFGSTGHRHEAPEAPAATPGA